MGVQEDRRRPHPDRDLRGLAVLLSRRTGELQRLRLQLLSLHPGQGRALEGEVPLRRVPAQPADDLRVRRRRAERYLPLRYAG